MHSDPIADMLARLSNASRAKHSTCTFMSSKVKKTILAVLLANKFVRGFQEHNLGKMKEVKVDLIKDKILNIKRSSKPGQRIYIKSSDVQKVQSGLGIGIYSTSIGLLTNNEARRKKVGGELICEIY